jgi:hypothetical protein
MSCDAIKRAGILCATLLLSACATPQPVLDLASRGVGAVTMAEVELQRYLAAAHDNLSARVVIVRQLSAAELQENYQDSFAAFLKGRTGDTGGEDVGALIRTLGQERRRQREKFAADLAALDDRNTRALGDAVRPPTEAFAATRNAFAPLAQELSPEEWLKLTAFYAREIHATVKKIKEEADAAPKKPAPDAAKPDAKKP